MHSMLRNLRYSLRTLRKNPGLTLTVLLTLALGIGANTAIFTVDYATLLAPLPYPQPNRLVMLWSRTHGERVPISAGDYVDWKRQSNAFEDVSAWTEGTFNMASGDQPEIVTGRIATPGMYRMLGLPFFLGRDFLPEEGQPGREHEVILTHKLWLRLGANPRILAQTLRLNNRPYTVVGVLPAGLYDRGQGELVVPLAFTPQQLNHDAHWLTAMGRLKPGVSIRQAQTGMDALVQHLAQVYPQSEKGWEVSVEPLKNDFLPSDRILTLWLLLGAVAFVLLIACVNVANLLLARSLTRQKELAVRSALGAKGGTLFGQLITESLALAIAGGLLGIGVGYAMLQGLIAVTPPDTLPSEADLRLNLPILLVALAATTLAGLLFGCAPAWYASRIDPAEALKESGRSGSGLGRQRLRRILVVGEFALALALLAGAGLAIHSFTRLLRVDLGVRTDHVLTFSLPVPDWRSKDPDRIVAYYRQILSSIASVSGVSDVSAQTGQPLYGAGFGMSFSIAGKPVAPDPSLRPVAGFGMVTPDYFRTFGIRLLQGRAFTAQDTAAGVKVAMVNEAFVHQFLSGMDPLRQRVVVQQLIPGLAQLGPPIDWQIVGVFHNVRSRGLREETPEIEVPFWQSPWPGAKLGVRTTADPASMTRSIAAAVHAVDPQIAVANPRTMEQVRDDVLAGDRFTLILFVSFAGIALLLAGVGIYGVMNFSVAQRSHEIALRMALGSTRNGVVALVVREGVVLTCAGLFFGLIGACFVGREMQSLFYGVSAMDLSAFAAVALILLLAALLACYLPARRAASTDPMQVLRTE